MFTEKLHYSREKKIEIIYNLRKKGLSFVKIAQILGVSRQRIHQLHKNYTPGQGRSLFEKKIQCAICGEERIITKDCLAKTCDACSKWAWQREKRNAKRTMLRQFQKKSACEMCLHPFEEKGQHSFLNHNRCVKCMTQLNKRRYYGDKRLEKELINFYTGEQIFTTVKTKWFTCDEKPYINQ